MKRMTIEMPVVSECMAGECAYNVGNNCHARAITVGNSMHPGCDTFLLGSHHTSNHEQIAGIGACKTTGCSFNEEFECMADNVQVGLLGSEANCTTYSPRVGA